MAIVLHIELDEGRAAFEPGARVGGTAAWLARVAPAGLELRLTWASYGPGGRDFKIANVISFDKPRAAERRPFAFTLPTAPYSFRGNLTSLVWRLQLVALPGEEKASVELTVAPDGEAIDVRTAAAGG
ncbi:MAG TPA: hypothetical protein VMU50_01405 [Polyangia bacterium]|nr:hypothetical protein [Polyangia bacterium]